MFHTFRILSDIHVFSGIHVVHVFRVIRILVVRFVRDSMTLVPYWCGLCDCLRFRVWCYLLLFLALVLVSLPLLLLLLLLGGHSWEAAVGSPAAGRPRLGGPGAEAVAGRPRLGGPVRRMTSNRSLSIIHHLQSYYRVPVGSGEGNRRK